MIPNAIAKTGKLPGAMGANMSGPGGPGGSILPPTPDVEKPSLGKVKDLLQQAMDMVAELGVNETVPGETAMPPMPPPGPRPPMKPRPSSMMA